MNRVFDVMTAGLGSLVRLGAGVVATRGAVAPEQTLELYEYEASPHCRKVREALTELDLDVVIHPCPRGGTVHRPRAESLGGKQQFPLLLDPNTSVVMYESMEIIDYLFTRYGDGRPPARIRFTPLADTTSYLASAVRLHRGHRARRNRQPENRLELYSMEASPYSRLAREALCELELSYVLHNLGRASAIDHLPPPLRQRIAPDADYSTDKRRQLAERIGRVTLPYLIDPNTGVELAESGDIVRYLDETYAVA